MWRNGRHFGRFGFRINCIFASCGRRFPLRVLQGMHEHTMFSHEVCPPRSRGRMWSRFRFSRENISPHYWQVCLSRSKTLCLVNFTSFFGRRSKNRRTMIRGILTFIVMVLTISG